MTSLDVVVGIVLASVALTAGVGAVCAVDAEESSWAAVLTLIFSGITALAILYAVENHYRPDVCCACPAEATATTPKAPP